MMGKWENGDPGVINQKTPTTLLLTPKGEFNSFGFTARNNYQDLSPEEATEWMLFDHFKMSLYKANVGAYYIIYYLFINIYLHIHTSARDL